MKCDVLLMLGNTSQKWRGCGIEVCLYRVVGVCENKMGFLHVR